MARNGSGTYSRTNGTNSGSTTWALDAAAGTKILSTRHDLHDQDIAAALTASIANDGQTPILANLPMSTFAHTGVGVATTRTMYARASQIQDNSLVWGGTSGGSANTQTISLTPAITAYTTGMKIAVLAGFTNTDTVTLNANGVGATTIKGVSGSNLPPSTIIAGSLFEVTYNGTNWILLTTNPTPPGSVQMYTAATAPTGWLLCDGTAVSRTTYAGLFAIISTAYGVGDGSTTFNLPDVQQKFPLGKAASGTGSTLGGSGGTIDHTHTAPAHYHGMGTGADLNITSGGAHQHFIENPDSGSSAVSSSNYLTDSATFGTDFSYTHRGSATVASQGLTSSTSHTHTSGTIAGSIGLVTGGVNGNAAMTSGTGNPPFVTFTFIIKT